MKINSLEYFVALSESRSINEAAQKLYVAQPSLTKSLKQLEEELGIILFTRSRDGIILTDAGKQILPEAKQVLAYYHKWKQLGSPQKLQQINLFATISISDFLLPDLLRNFKKSYHDLTIEFSEILTADQIPYNNQLPSVYLSVIPESHPQFAPKAEILSFTLCEGEYTCLVNKNSPLAGNAAISAKELENLYFVTISPSKSMDSFPLSLLGELIPYKQIIQVTSSNSIIRTLLRDAETYAVAYHPALFRYEEILSGNLTYIPFENRLRSNITLSCSRRAYQQYPVVKEFVNTIRKAYHDFLSNI